MPGFYAPQLPGYQLGRGVDFSILNEGLDALGKHIEKNRLLAEQKELAQSLGKTPTSTSSSSPQYAPTNRLLSNSSPAQYGAANAAERLPAGMRNNNPGNIKYIKTSAYPGMTGPSANTDQGDPQMVFDNPQNGMNAAASLAYKKYAGGKRTAADLIAGEMGWTPGNVAAAQNIARTMGVRPDEDLRLDDPTRMQAFLKALTLQEHGQASRQYGDDLYRNAASRGSIATPSPVSAPATASQAPSRLNYAEGMRVAASQGNVDAMLKLQALEQDEANNAQASELRGLQVQSAREELATKAQVKLAAVAQRVAEMPPEQAAAVWPKVLAVNPRLATTLQQYGIDPNDYKAGTALIVAEARGLSPATDKQRYTASRQGVLDTYTGEIKPLPPGSEGSDAEHGTSLNYYRGKDGKTYAFQTSKAGGRRDIELPEGAEILPGIDYKDIGTGFVPFQKRSGDQAGPVVPKDLAGAEAQKKVGEATGQAIVDLPKVRGATAVVLGMIESVEKDPYLSSMTGPIQGRLPNLSGDAARVQSKVAQLQGTAFLQAFQEIKGGGAITEVEGAKAEAAKSRLLALNVNDADYPAALKEFKDEVIRLGQLAETKASGPGSGSVAPQQTAAPYPGARQAPDGNWYVEQNGQFFRVDQ